MVVGDHPPILEAQEVIESLAFWPGQPGRMRIVGRHGEAPVVAREVLGQYWSASATEAAPTRRSSLASRS